MVAATSTSMLCQAKPTNPGVPVGVDDWRLVVERMGATEGAAVVGVGQIGTIPDGGSGEIVGAVAWVDVTDAVRGMEWTRGAQAPNGRPLVGEINVTVVDRDGEFDPWRSYAANRPGVVWRCGLVSDTDVRADGWLPQWTAVTEKNPITYVAARSSGYRADAFADVSLVETLSLLSTVNDNALGSPAGSGDTVAARVDRLLSAADWQFGMVEIYGGLGEPTTALQATDMSANRLAELYLTADSCCANVFGFLFGVVVRSDVTGAVLVTTREGARETRLKEFSTAFGNPEIVLGASDDFSTALWGLGYDFDTFVTANDRDGLVNDHRYARVGGTQQIFEHEVSIGRFKARATRARNDLICTTDGAALEVAEADNIREARTVLRVEQVTVGPVIGGASGSARPNAVLALAAADIGDIAWCFPPADPLSFGGSGAGPIRAMIHAITPMKGTVQWTATYAVDPDGFTNLPGSTLDPA